MGTEFEQEIDIEFEEDKRLEKEYLEELRDIFYSDETDFEAAKNYSFELAEYYFFYDDSISVLSKVIRELRYVQPLYSADQEIAEDLARCLSIWVYGRSSYELRKIKTDIMRLRAAFPNSEDIAEAYSVIISFFARNESNVDVCNEYYVKISELLNDFPNNEEIQDNYIEIKEKVSNKLKYNALFSEIIKLKTQFEYDSSLNKAIELAKKICELTKYKEESSKSRSCFQLLVSLTKDYSDCIEIIESLVGALYNITTMYAYNEGINRNTIIIKYILNKYPKSKIIAEYNMKLQDGLAEDEKRVDGLVLKVERDTGEVVEEFNTTEEFGASLSSDINLSEGYIREKVYYDDVFDWYVLYKTK